MSDKQNETDANIQYVTTAAMARAGQLICVENKDKGTNEFYFLASRTDQSTKTAYLCIPIVELDDDTVEEIKRHNVRTKGTDEAPRFFFQLDQHDTSANFNRVIGGKQLTSFHYGLDLENPTILVDNPRVTSSKPTELAGKIGRSLKLTGTLGQIMQGLSNKIVHSDHPTVETFRQKFHTLDGSLGKTFNYTNIIGTYGFDMKHGRFKEHRDHKRGNANIRKHGTVNPPAPEASAE